MDYAEAQAAFFQPRSDAVDGVLWSSPARELRDALEPLATVHYWSRASSRAYAELGLDFLTGYVWSRACVLGEPVGTARTRSASAAATAAWRPASPTG